MKQSTKEKILTAGAELIHHKGYNHTGIQEILTAANVPKGSFYNYFRSKVEFGLCVVDFFSGHFEGLSKEILDDRTTPPLKRIYNMLGYFIEFFRSKAFTLGCPIGNLSQEMGDLSPVFRVKLKDAMDTMVKRYADVLEEAKRTGDIPKNLDTLETASFLVASWHGALVHMKIVINEEPLESHRKFIFERVLKM